MKSNKGFSGLILLIIVAVVIIIAAVIFVTKGGITFNNPSGTKQLNNSNQSTETVQEDNTTVVDLQKEIENLNIDEVESYFASLDQDINKLN